MLKINIYDYMHNMRKNIFIIIQLVIMFLLTTFLSSTVFSRLGIYRAFHAEVGEGKGVVVHMIDVDTLDKLYGVSSVIYGKTSFLSYQNKDMINPVTANVYTYNDSFSKYASPVLTSGVWCDSIMADRKLPNCVVFPNDYGIGTGDTVEFTTDGGKTVTMYVSGMLKEEQYIYVGDKSSVSSYQEECDYTNLMCKSGVEETDSETGNKIRFLEIVTTDKQLQKAGVELEYAIGNALIGYRDDISEEEMAENVSIIKENVSDKLSLPESAIPVFDLDTFYSNSQKRLASILYTYIPVIIISVVLILISMLGFEYLMVQKSLTRYSVYFMLGTPWRRLIFISVFQKAVNALFAFLIFYGIYSVCGLTELKNKIFISLTGDQIILLFLISMIYVIAGVVIPQLVLKKSSPDEIIRKARVQ